MTKRRTSPDPVIESSPSPAFVLQDIDDALEIAGREGTGNPLPLAPDFAEIIAKLRPVLTVSEIAEIAGVKERQVHHWASGAHNPQGDARGRLLALHQIISHLETLLSAERIKVWLWSPHSDLPGTPASCMQEGKLNLVLAIAKRAALREETEDKALVELAKKGNSTAYDALVRRYRGFVRLKASSYYLLGGEPDDLIQEGLLGLYKAIRDYRLDEDGDFQDFARLCITRQIVAAVKKAIRTSQRSSGLFIPLLGTSADSIESKIDESAAEGNPINDLLPRATDDLANQAIARNTLEELVSMISRLSGNLSDSESRVLSLYLDGYSYEQTAERLSWNVEEVDAALQRVKRKIGRELSRIKQSES